MSDKRTETCCCTGHRDIPYGLETPLKSVLRVYLKSKKPQ